MSSLTLLHLATATHLTIAPGRILESRFVANRPLIKAPQLDMVAITFTIFECNVDLVTSKTQISESDKKESGQMSKSPKELSPDDKGTMKTLWTVCITS